MGVALDGLMKYDVAVLVPGHGLLGGKEALSGQRAYLQGMIDGVRAGMAHGQTADQIAGSLDLTGYAPWGADKTRNIPSIKAIHAKLQKK